MKRYSRLQDLLSAAVSAHSHKTAIRTASAQVSYGELHQQVLAVAAGLIADGVRANDRVAWLLPNCFEAVVTTLACYQIGALAVPLNYRYTAHEVEETLKHVEARVLIFHGQRDDVGSRVANTRIVESSFCVGEPCEEETIRFDELRSHALLEKPIAVREDDPALILFTSGSTGRPKGVVHSHCGVFSAIDISRRLFDFQEHDVVLVGKSLSHAGGLQTQLMASLQAAAEVVLTVKPSPAEAAALIDEHQVTEYGMLASDLLDFIEYLEGHPSKLPSLKNSIGSGDKVPVDLHHRFRDLFGWPVMEGAGMTEVGCYYAANPRYGERKWGSLGLPAPDTELRVVGDAGEACPPNAVGEILVRSPSSTIGYWQDEASTKSLYQDGWLRTGDLGHCDDSGYYWFVGRKKLMIVRRGSNIAPAEVEDVLDEHPRVHASVVVGVPDNRDGQVPVACIALLPSEEPFSEEELRSFVAQRLAAYKNPTRYFILPELPRNSTGKFDRHALQELVEKAIRKDASS